MRVTNASPRSKRIAPSNKVESLYKGVILPKLSVTELLALDTELELELELELDNKLLIDDELKITEELLLDELITITTRELLELDTKLLELNAELLELDIEELITELFTEELLDNSTLDDDATSLDWMLDDCIELLISAELALLEALDSVPAPPQPLNNVKIKVSRINLTSSKLRLDRPKTSKLIKTLPSLYGSLKQSRYLSTRAHYIE